MMDAQLDTTLGQALLFSPEIEGRIEEEERKGRYTAERFKVRRKAAYDAAVQLLGAGVGLQKIGRWLGVHPLTIAAVRDREQKAIDMASQTLKQLDTAIALQLERLLENPGLVPMTHVGQLIDGLIRNRELLAGRATARVEHVEGANVHDDWEGFLQTLVSEKELPAEMVQELRSSAPGLGLVGEEICPIEAGSAGAAPPDGELAIARAPGKGERPETDEESDARPEGNRLNLASNLTSRPPDPATSGDPPTSVAEGGGGSRAREGGPPSQS